MEDLLELIGAFFEAFKKRANGPASSAPRPGLGRALRQAFAERIPGPATALEPVPPGSRMPAPRPAIPVVPRAAPAARPAPGTGAALGGASGVPREPTFGSAGRVARAPEAGLVRALFATPQSLVAAFIVAEVLAKPVALREP